MLNITIIIIIRLECWKLWYVELFIKSQLDYFETNVDEC